MAGDRFAGPDHYAEFIDAVLAGWQDAVLAGFDTRPITSRPHFLIGNVAGLFPGETLVFDGKGAVVSAQPQATTS